jgi:hypothetical protein
MHFAGQPVAFKKICHIRRRILLEGAVSVNLHQKKQSPV